MGIAKGEANENPPDPVVDASDNCPDIAIAAVAPIAFDNLGTELSGSRLSVESDLTDEPVVGGFKGRIERVAMETTGFLVDRRPLRLRAVDELMYAGALCLYGLSNATELNRVQELCQQSKII